MTTAPGAANRPLSPHLQVWRFHVTMLGSILHRISGVGLYGGALILAGWALALASGPDAYAGYTGLLGSIPGKLVLFAITVSFFYHLFKGLQHLVWDTGRGFTLRSANAVSLACILLGLGAALSVWYFIVAAGLF